MKFCLPSPNSVVQFTWSHVRALPDWHRLACGYTVDMCLNLVKWTAFSWIGRRPVFDSSVLCGLTFWVAVTICVSQMYNAVTAPHIIRSNQRVEKSIIDTHLGLYARFSLPSKNVCPVEVYEERLAKANQAAQVLLDWGMPIAVKLLNDVLSCILVCVQSGFVWLPAVLVLLNATFYFWKIRAYQQQLSGGRDARQKQVNRLSTRVTLCLPLFEQDEVSAARLSELYDERRRLTYFDIFSYRKLECMFTALHNASLVLLLAFLCANAHATTVPSVLMVITVMNNINSSFRNFSRFYNIYEQHAVKFNAFAHLFDHARLETPVPQHKIPAVTTVTAVDIRQGAFRLACSSTLQIQKGDRLLITGPSGSGKSLFINALLGKLPGVSFGFRQPAAFKNDAVYYYQAIREKTPLTKTSVVDLIRLATGSAAELNEPLFRKICAWCCVSKWVSSADLCSNINNRISGGQKSRLLLAVKIYQALVSQAGLLVLDEPEQGSDPDVAYRMLQTVVARMPATTTIVISSHLERVRDAISFDTIVKLGDGAVAFARP